MNDWRETILGELITFQRGHDLPQTQFKDGKYPIFGSNGIIGYHDEYTTDAPGITIGRSGSIGNPFYIESKFWAHNTTLYVKKFHNSFPKFIFYLLTNINFQLFNSGSAVPSLNRNYIHPFPVLVPEIQEQKRIADILSCLDAKIKNLRSQNQTLEKIAQTLFDRWFIDFEFPNDSGEPYKSSGGAMVASELGDIPVGWRVGKLGDVATNHSETHKFKDKKEIIFVNTGDVQEGFFLHETYSAISTLPGQAKKRIAENNILYSEIRPINKRFAYVTYKDNLDDYVVSTKFMVIKANDLILPRLLYLILKRRETVQNFQQVAESRSGTFPQITFESISDFSILLANTSIQQKLMSTITPLLEKKEFNNHKIQTLTKTRDTLLPKLMSGQIRIPE